jgi:hypothetical protein
MGDDLDLGRAFGKYIVYLFTSLFVATVIVFLLGMDPEPRTPGRLVAVVVFFSVFTLLFLWEAGHLNH